MSQEDIDNSNTDNYFYSGGSGGGSSTIYNPEPEEAVKVAAETFSTKQPNCNE